MMIFYRIVFYPIFFLLAYLGRFAHPKLKAYFQLRKNAYKDMKALEGAIWFHCSSGEIEYAKPIIRWLRQKYPGEKIVVTYFSNSVLENTKRIAEIDGVLPLPFDTRSRVKEFLILLKPKVLFVARTDLWPEVLHQTKKAKIPIALFSATLSEENLKYKNALARYLFQKLLDKLSLVICVSPEDKARFQTFRISKLEMASDTRYLQVIERLKNKKDLPVKLQNEKPVLLLGSTWSEDEAELLPQLMSVLTEGFQVIIVPHEVSKSHLRSLYEDLDSFCVDYVTWSKIKTWTSSDVLVVDQVGYLAELYDYAELAFIGGSFKKQVHSVMEALASGCLTFVGPYYKNNREAIDFQEVYLQGARSVQVIETGADLMARLQKWKANPNKQKFRQELRAEIHKRAEDAKKTFDIIDEFLANPIKNTDA